MKDPHPTYVSIVNHGAIQQPFKVLKSAKPTGASAMPIARRDLSAAPVKKVAKPVAVHKLVFDKQYFPAEAKVTEYLANNGYSDFSIKADENQFTVQSNVYTKDMFTRVNKVDMEKGVTGFVGTLTEEAVQKTAAKPPEAAPAGQERALKLDWYAMYMSNGVTPSDIIEDGMEANGTPPGFVEIMEAVNMAIVNVLTAEGVTNYADHINAIFTEAASYVNALVQMFMMASSEDESVQKKEKVAKFVQQLKTELTTMTTKAKKDEAQAKPAENAKKDETAAAPAAVAAEAAPAEPAKKDEAASAPAAEAAPVAEAAPAAVQEPAPAAEAAPASFDAKGFGEVVGLAIKSALEPVTKQIADLATKVTEQATALKEVQEKTTKAASEVTTFVERFPAKKGSTDSIDTSGTETPEQQKQNAKKQEAVRGLRSAVGF